jgi:nicotinamidase-related amidase
MNASEPSAMPRSPEVLQAATSRLVIVDVQEKFLPTLPDVPRLVASCRLLIECARLFSVPVFATEQYPQGLGPTTGELAELLPPPLVKQEFSGWSALGWPPAAEDATGRHQVVVAGIEAHVCILQTSLDLLAAGYRVFVVADAVASRRDSDRDIAFQRMLSAGITLATAESVGFEWCERSDRAEFKAWSRLVKNRPL